MYLLKKAIVICFFCLGCCVNILSQAKFEISQPTLKLLNDRLIVKYDILGVDPDDRFNVKLEISDSKGNKIKANSVFGDIGDNVSGGNSKQIIWDMAADSVYLNIDISVEILVTKILPPKPDIAALKNTDITATKTDSSSAEKKATSAEKEKKSASYKSVKTGSNLLLSTLVPGLGLTRLSEGKPYWILGLAGYGCLASSVYFNHQSASNYNKYLDSSKADEFDDYFTTGEKQYHVAKVLAWSAVAIWLADIGITWIKASKMKSYATKSKLTLLSVGSTFNNFAHTPQITLVYTF
jgi:hypothetical protein